MAKTTIAVPEGHHVEIHAPIGAGAPAPASAGPPPGVIPDPTAQGMQGAMDQALATAPKPKAAPKPPESKGTHKTKKKKKAKGEPDADDKSGAPPADHAEPDEDD